MKRSQVSFLLALVVMASACKGKESDGGSNPPPLSDDQVAASESTEALSDSLAEFIDDVDPASQTLSTKSSDAAALNFCRGVAALQPCINGVRSISYDHCRLLFRGNVFGTVELRYSDINCRLDVEGDSVGRIYDLLFTNGWGQTSVSAADHQDYRGVTIGGGGRATRVASGWDLTLLGQRRIHKGPAGRVLRDISLVTLEPLKVRGSRRDNNRVLEAGTLEINHNLAKYSVKYTATNLVLDTSCCYPTAGTLEATFSGSINAAGVVEYQGCGKAQLTLRNGEIRDLTLNACQYK